MPRAKVWVIRDEDEEWNDTFPLGVQSAHNKLCPSEPNPPLLRLMSEEKQWEWAKKVLEANGVEPAHGDVVRIYEYIYRNEGIRIYDANTKEPVRLATKIDDYGHMPKQFKIGKGGGEFSWRHWEGISQNEFAPFWSSKKNKWYNPYDDEYYTDDEPDSE